MNIIKTNFNYIASKLLPRDISKIDRIILHHAAIKFCIAEDIHKWHLDKGWAGAGYNFLVRKDGSIYELRDLKYVPAHATGFNTCSIGVCFEGDFEKEEMGQVQINAGKELVAYLKEKYNISLVQKHNDVNNTSCPGSNFPFNEIANGQATDIKIEQPTQTPQDQNTDIFKDGKINCIYDIQEWLNNKYGANLELDNIYGPKTKSALIKALQHELNIQYNKGLAEDGIFGNNTYNACITVKQGAKGNITVLIQMALFIKEYKLDVDGIFGADTNLKVRDFQNKNGLTVDGIVGKNTFKALFA